MIEPPEPPSLFSVWREKIRYIHHNVLGMNLRNSEFIFKHNPIELFPLVDNKILTKKALDEKKLPTPKLFFTLSSYFEVNRLKELIQPYDTFVIKPANGFGGEGVLIIAHNHGEELELTNGSRITLREVSDHIKDILSGLYSLSQMPDQVLCEDKLEPDPVLNELTYKGIPDIRVVVFRGVPVMAMLRLSTKKSQGKANLHQGGIGVGVDLSTGLTTHAIYSGQFIENHPDSGNPLVGTKLPLWEEILHLATRCHEAAPLGYMGADIVIDPRYGPMVLELNVRPGLMIQMANRRGIKPILMRLQKQPIDKLSVSEKVALGQRLFREC